MPLSAIDDLVLFSANGKLAHVEAQWAAVKKYALLVHEGHSQALVGVQRFLMNLSKREPSTEDELDDLFVASTEFDALTEATTLVKSLVFLLLASFHEFGLKEVQRLLEPRSPPPEKYAYKWILSRLEAHGLMSNRPSSYGSDFEDHRDSVRNNLAHGDWLKLAREIQTLDLEKAFIAQAGLFVSIGHKLIETGYDV